jgi:hypothetical protein
VGVLVGVADEDADEEREGGGEADRGGVLVGRGEAEAAAVRDPSTEGAAVLLGQDDALGGEEGVAAEEGAVVALGEAQAVARGVEVARALGLAGSEARAEAVREFVEEGVGVTLGVELTLGLADDQARGHRKDRSLQAPPPSAM